MSFLSLLLRNLLYHLRGNVAVFLGVALGAAVLTGALLVGDSLRGSLRTLASEQLGWVDQALMPGRFFRADLAKDLPADKATSLIMLQGSAVAGAESAGKVQILGVGPSFWEDADDAEFWSEAKSQVEPIAINQALADRLKVKAGDTIKVYLSSVDSSPRETLLGKRKARELEEDFPDAVIRKVLPNTGMASFSPRPSPVTPFNLFVPIGTAQKKLKLVGKANMLLVGKPRGDLGKILSERLTLEDWNLRLTTPEQRVRSYVEFLGKSPNDKREGDVWLALADFARSIGLDKEADVPAAKRKLLEMFQKDKADAAGPIAGFYRKARPYVTLESTQMFLEPAAEHAAREAASRLALSSYPVFIYLADNLKTPDGSWQSPYAVVAGVPPRKLPHPVAKNEIVDNQIYLTDVNLPKPSPEKLLLSFYAPDQKGDLKLEEREVIVKGVVPLEGAANDPDWAPEFPGITNVSNMEDWETPGFPFDRKRVQTADSDYWRRYKTSPKAYVSLQTAQKWWASRFGNVTSVRVFAPEGSGDFEKLVLQNLNPQRGGFVFQPLRERSLEAGGGSTDFGQLFLAFSFFLIVSALLLVGLLVRLNLDRRAQEMGLLLATGWSQGRVWRLLMGEGLLLVLAGSALGLIGARYYADGMLEMLRRNWPEGSTLSFLKLYTTPTSYGIGYGASVVVGLATLYFAIRGLGKIAPPLLLMGQSTPPNLGQTGAGRCSLWVMILASLGALAAFVAALTTSSAGAQAGSFFGAGMGLLIAFLAGVWRWLHRAALHSDPQPSLSMLALRNAGRNPLRSLLTTGLLASASFLIVAVQAFHEETHDDFLARSAGNYALFAETDLPFFQDFNDADVRSKFFRAGTDEQKLLAGIGAMACRIQPGDDASCLNLYKPLRPRVLGVPDVFVQRGGFTFKSQAKSSPEERANPWLLLDLPAEDGIHPVILDANSAQWIVKVGLGDTIELNDALDAQGKPKKLRVVGLLKESIFQSEMLVSEKAFLELYPRQEGYQFFLFDVKDQPALAVQSALQKGMVTQGWNVAQSRERLQAYREVSNTYLATFQALGGLGLLLGALGLAVVLVRGVWERRRELALLRALGFQGRQLGWLVFLENAFLLVLGLAVGTLAALLAVAPHLVGSGANVLWGKLLGLLALVLAVGLGAGALAVYRSLQTPVLVGLRRE